jgi:hypothetical protein
VTATVEEATTTPEEIKGRSLTQIAWGRLRHDKTFIASAIILLIVLLVALFAPLITGWLGLDPYATDKTAISTSGGKPNGPWGGASLEHPLGVEWGTGRDILADINFVDASFRDSNFACGNVTGQASEPISLSLAPSTFAFQRTTNFLAATFLADNCNDADEIPAPPEDCGEGSGSGN